MSFARGWWGWTGRTRSAVLLREDGLFAAMRDVIVASSKGHVAFAGMCAHGGVEGADVCFIGV